jgi:predicted phosphoribosyltransferase
MHNLPATLHELPELRNRRHVFRDRRHAGEILAGMLAPRRGSDAIVLAIPAGGVPVAVEIARRLELPLDVAVVSKLTLPWNTEAGFGALAFDGTLRLNEALVAQAGLSASRIETVTARTREKVARRVRELRGARPFPDLAQRPAILVDDGLASGFTLAVAIEALRHQCAQEIVVAVPTAHAESAARIARLVSALYCANLREGRSYAVADAYQEWCDVDETELRALLATVIRD